MCHRLRCVFKKTPTTEISHQEDMLVTYIDGFIENSDCIATQIGAMSVDYQL